MKKIFLLLTLFSVGFINFVDAQFYILGQDPASVKWKQIKTPAANIIFPEGYYFNANLYANTLELTRSVTLKPYLTTPQKPFTMVLHTQSTWSNAMVFPAPLHGDFFETPIQTTYPQIWQYLLSLHEYRHYAQMRMMYSGVGKALGYIFGQAGPMALFGAFIPMWFVEGDAVYNETIHSKSGRGRVPSFIMDLKAQVVEKKIYPYDKAILGSYRDYVPDYYTLGYQLVLYGAQNYGYNMWNLAMERVARRPYLLKPFVNGLKTYTGLRKVKYYHKVLNTLQTEWKSELTAKQLTHPKYIVPIKPLHDFTSYRFPTRLSDGSIIAEKTGIDDVNRFVRVTSDGHEQVLFTPGFDYTESLSANDSLLCWNEKQYDLRWGNRDYSIIKLFNFKTGELRTITRKTKLFAPDISPDARQIVATSVSEEGKYSLEIIDKNSGAVLSSFATGDNLFFMTPKWSDDGKYVVATVLGKQGKSILLFEPETGKHQIIMPFSFAEISRPVKSGNQIFFTGSYNGSDNIYTFDLSTKKVSQLTNVKYGIENIDVTPEGLLLFSNYTADGYRISLLNPDTLTPKRLNTLAPFHYPINRQVNNKTFVLEDTIVPDVTYQQKEYSRAKHLFNPHTWGPLLFDVNNYALVPNLVIASQNMLSTAVSSLGYYYDINEKTGKTKFTFDYYGWFPVIGFQADFSGRKFAYTDKNGNPQSVHWYETNLSLNTSVPLKFIKSKWISGITPKVTIGQKFMTLAPNQNIELKESQLTFLTYSLYGYRSLKRSRLDIFNKWSMSFYTAYSHTPFSSKVSSVGYVTGTFTLPGLFKHHGFKVYIAKEWKKSGNYQYSDYISIPRGYSELSIEDMVSLKSDYAFPIAYPDWDLQSAAYLTRIYAHLFFDYAQYHSKNNPISYIGSSGVELYTNWHFLSLPVEFTLGFRGTYKFSGSFNPEFLFGFGL